jgi:multiple sugar transport system permease protein/raffinose/stachyose/melibiose transport system permease protein
VPIGAPAILTTATLNHPVERIPVCGGALTDDGKRTRLSAHAFHGKSPARVGMAATGLMIAMLPVVVIYAFFSETMIKGMTAGAVR